MVSLQIISKVLATGSNELIETNMLTEEYFVGYEEEFNFIQEHIQKYGNTPDKTTFLSKFPQFELVDVAESDEYLINTVKEEYLYYKSVPIIQKAAELLKSDSNAAAEYLIGAINTLQPDYDISGTDIISQAKIRLEEYKLRKDNPDVFSFTSGFPELDDVIHNIQRKEELLVIFARTNQGKSWVAEKIATHIWEIGFNVGYISPEMSGTPLGYRFDTLHRNYSNKDLMFGGADLDALEYEEYINELSTHENKFIVSTPKDFANKITVSKLKQYVQKYNLNLLVVDGIKYLTDERYKKGDSTTTSLTNISEDLMTLSIEAEIPIIAVVQSNRGGVKGEDDKGTPDLENIRDSDGISHNATKVLSIRHKDNDLHIGIKKQRFGRVGDTIKYHWDVNIGEFTYISDVDSEPVEDTTETRDNKSKDNVVKMPNRADVF